MDYPASDPNSDTDADRFEQKHYQVFLVYVLDNTAGNFWRFIYVEINDLRLGAHKGHRFWVGRSVTGGLQVRSTENRLQNRDCSHPFTSDPRARMRLVGWVRRKGVEEEIRLVLGPVSRISYDCCHDWTDAALSALRTAKVLIELREPDNGATIYGPNAMADDTD